MKEIHIDVDETMITNVIGSHNQTTRERFIEICEKENKTEIERGSLTGISAERIRQIHKDLPETLFNLPILRFTNSQKNMFPLEELQNFQLLPDWILLKLYPLMDKEDIREIKAYKFVDPSKQEIEMSIRGTIVPVHAIPASDEIDEGDSLSFPNVIEVPVHEPPNIIPMPMKVKESVIINLPEESPPTIEQFEEQLITEIKEEQKENSVVVQVDSAQPSTSAQELECPLGTQVEKETPLKKKRKPRGVHTNKSENLTSLDVSNITTESSIEFGQLMLAKIVCVFTTIMNAVITGRKITFADFGRDLLTLQRLEQTGTDVKEALYTLVNQESPDKAAETEFNRVVTMYMEKFTAFQETHRYDLVQDVQQVYEMRKICSAYSAWYLNISQQQRLRCNVLNNQHATVQNRIKDFFENTLPSVPRQETFLVLLRGPTGHGKTEYAKFLSKEISHKVCGLTAEKGVQAFPAKAKYWPPLADVKPVWRFDEACDTKDPHECLLFNNVKTICSTEPFNCPAADVNNKIAPCCAKVVIATSNTQFHEIESRLAQHFQADAWQAYMRRSIVLNVERRDLKDFNPDTPETNKYETDWNHLIMTRMRYVASGTTCNTVPVAPEQNPDTSHSQLMKMIVHKYQYAEKKWKRDLASYRQNLQAGTNHFSVCLHGKSGAGKSSAMDSISIDMSRMFGMRMIAIKTKEQLLNFKKQTLPIVCYIDDVVRNSSSVEIENALMDLYNNKLVYGSMILNTSNLTPKWHVPFFRDLNLFSQRSLPFKQDGTARRLGYVGDMNYQTLPTYNLEYYVKNETYSRAKDIVLFPFAEVINKVRTSTILHVTLGAIFLACLFEAVIPLTLLLIGIILFLLSFFPNHYEKSVIGTVLKEEVFEGYRKFLSGMQDIPVHFENFSKRDDYNFQLLAEKASEVKFSESAAEIDDHVFADYAKFTKSKSTWKTYITKGVFDAFLKKRSEFMINTDGLGFSEILLLVKKYVNGFRKNGVEPCFYVEIDDVGKFQFADGRLSCSREAPTKTSNVKYVYDNGTDFLEFPDKHGKPQRLAYEVIAEQGECLTQFELTMAQHDEYVTYMKSPTFLNEPRYQECLQRRVKETLQAQYLAAQMKVKDTVSNILAHPLGKIVFGLVALYLSYQTVKLVAGLFKKKKDKSVRKSRHEMEKRGDLKARKRIKTSTQRSGDRATHTFKVEIFKEQESFSESDYESDEEEEVQLVKTPIIPVEEMVPTSLQNNNVEAVTSLVDVNHVSTYHSQTLATREIVNKNLCQVYIYASDKDWIPNEPTAHVGCYGLFVKEDIMVTVGHIVKRTMGANIFICIDEREGSYRAELLKNYENRDLSVWWIPGFNKHNPPTRYKSLKKQFFKRGDFEEGLDYNMLWCRYSPRLTPQGEKVIEYHSGEMTYYTDLTGFDCRKKMGLSDITDFAEVLYGVNKHSVSTPGDCGLPYFSIDRELAAKVPGIHIMGTGDSWAVSTTMSVIYQDDIESWGKMRNSLNKAPSQCLEQSSTREHVSNGADQIQSETCGWCGKTEFSMARDENCVDEETYVVWNKNHDTKVTNILDEISFGFAEIPSFVGFVSKNSGKLYGSQEHSHTKFIVKGKDPKFSRQNKPITMTGKELGIIRFPDDKFIVRTYEFESYRIDNHLRKFLRGKIDYRIQMYLFHVNGRKRCTMRCILPETDAQIDLTPHSVNTATFQGKFTNPEGIEIDAPDEIGYIFDEIEQCKRMNKTCDVPFNEVSENETVRVIGPLAQIYSFKPKDKYFLNPFYDITTQHFPVSKRPVVLDLDKFPDEVLADYPVNSYGRPCPRTKQSLMWAHNDPCLDGSLLEAVELEIENKIKRYYSNHRILTDLEVLEGIAKEKKYFGGMELDTSIGFTMSKLFKVKKKSDVINVTPDGKYYWQQNPAAHFLYAAYEQAKASSDEGRMYYVCYQEILKMEKLKLSKIYSPRTFCVQDILGVIMERRNLGMLNVNAIKNDQTCGIGTDPLVNFNAIFERLRKHPNVFAGDYSSYDKTIPAILMYSMRNVLMRVNPTCAYQIKSTLNVLIQRYHVTGNTMAYITGGMPSGCTITATFNSLLNDYLMYFCFFLLSHKAHLPNSWQDFELNTERIYYGDDVVISVSDKYAKVFNRISIARTLKDYFEMKLDSADKDGKIAEFDTWNTIMWISRIWIKDDKYQLYFGALKKISIEANLHFVTDVSLPHIASLFDRILLESALWGDEYFNKMYECLKDCMLKKTALRKYFDLLTRPTIMANVRRAVLPTFYGKQNRVIINQIRSIKTNEILNTSCRVQTLHFKNIEIPFANAKLYLQWIQNNPRRVDFCKMSFACRINELFQKGKITKPKIQQAYSVTPGEATGIWTCTLHFRVSDGNPISEVETVGLGSSKSEAQEAASYQALLKMKLELRPCDIARTQNEGKGTPGKRKPKNTKTPQVHTSRLEMNVSPGTTGVVPEAKVLASDTTVVPDAGLFTNIGAPAMAVDMNATAVALDNPSATGASFSKEQSCFSIYREYKTTFIDDTLAAGAEVFRISLDPKGYPPYIKEYVMCHKSGVLSIEIVVALGGADGSIGWVTTGWVRDASKPTTLEELQEVTSKTANMNGTQILKFELHDVRRMGMYRLFDGDTEPWPGIVMLIRTGVTNVQRNDGVKYPVYVQMRLGRDTVLCEPFNSLTVSQPTSDLDLTSYFGDKNFNMLIKSSQTPDELVDTQNFRDDGWSAGPKFLPEFNYDLYGGIYYGNYADFGEKNIVNLIYLPVEEGQTPDSSIIENAKKGAFNSPGYELSNIMLPSYLYYACGDVPKRTEGTHKYQYSTEPMEFPGASYYTVDYKLDCGIPCRVKRAFIFPKGIILEIQLPIINVPASNENSAIKLCQILYCPSIEYDNTETLRMPFSVSANLENAFIYSLLPGGDLPQIPAPRTIRAIPIIKLYLEDSDGSGGIIWTSMNVKSNTQFFLETGSQIGSSLLPPGVKQVQFVPNGFASSSSNDHSFYVPDMYGTDKLRIACDNVVAKYDSLGLTGQLVINDVLYGYIGYANGYFFASSPNLKIILPALKSNVKLTNIKPLETLIGMPTFKTTQFSPFVTAISGSAFKKRPVGLKTSRCESYFAGAMGANALGGVFGALGSGFTEAYRWKKQREMYDMLLANQNKMNAANNQNQIDRINLAYENNVKLSGLRAVGRQSFTRNGYQNVNYQARNGIGSTLGDLSAVPPPASVQASAQNTATSTNLPEVDNTLVDSPTTFTKIVKPAKDSWMPAYKGQLNPLAPEFKPKSSAIEIVDPSTTPTPPPPPRFEDPLGVRTDQLLGGDLPFVKNKGNMTKKTPVQQGDSSLVYERPSKTAKPLPEADKMRAISSIAVKPSQKEKVREEDDGNNPFIFTAAKMEPLKGQIELKNLNDQESDEDTEA